jgi:ATP-binding cassette subfamily F protein 3
MVSHDRYLVDKLATQIWELRNGQLNIFRGTYRKFVMQHADFNAQNRQILLSPRPQARDNSRQSQKRQKALSRLEERIRAQESTMQHMNNALRKTGKSLPFDQLQVLGTEYAQAQSEMEDLIEEWEQLAA